MIFIDGYVLRRVCRTYGAPEYSLLRYPALTGWANLCRASGARELASLPRSFRGADYAAQARVPVLREPIEEFVPGAGEGEEPGPAVVEA
jgi:hypothetical protein